MSFPADPSNLPADAAQVGAPPVDGAPDALPEVDIPDAADMVDYTVPLSAEALRQLGQRIKREVEEYTQSVAQRRENALIWNADYEMLPADENLPWSNASAIRAPLTRVSTQSHATRLNGQVLGADPPFGVVARTEAAQEAAEVIQDVLTAALNEADWKRVARDLHMELAQNGNCLLRVQWRSETCWTPRHVTPLDDEGLAAAVQAGANPLHAFAEHLDRTADGQIKFQLQFQEQPLFDGPELSLTTFADMIVLPATATSPKDLWGLGELVRLRGMDLQEGARLGRFRQEAVDALLRRQSDEGERGEGEDEWVSGVQGSHGSADRQPLYRSYECVELDLLDDLNDDGRLEWYILTVHLESATVLRCTFSPYEHGRSRYVMFRYITRPGKLWAAGIPEILATTQDASTGAANNQQNLGDLLVGLAGNFAYDQRSQLRPSNITLAPGIPLFVPGSIDGIKPLNEMAASIPAGMQALGIAQEQLKGWAELLTASSNPALGKETDTSKTLGEVRLVLGNAMAVFENYAAGVALDWAQGADRVRWLMAQFDRDGYVEYRVSAAPAMQAGEDGEPVSSSRVWNVGDGGKPIAKPITGSVGFGKIPSDILRHDVDFVPAGLNAFADQQTRLQRSMAMQQLLAENPLTAQVPDVQLIALDQVLQDARMPRREQILQAARKALQQKEQAEQAQQQQAHQMQLLALQLQAAHLGLNGQGGPSPGPPMLPPGAGAPPPDALGAAGPSPDQLLPPGMDAGAPGALPEAGLPTGPLSRGGMAG